MGELFASNPVKLYKLAVRGMLPKTNLGKDMLKKLKVKGLLAVRLFTEAYREGYYA